MKTFLRFNPSICSINIGDQIIAQSIDEQLSSLFKGNFIIDASSHQPISWVYYARVLKNIDLTFVMGSNLLRGKLNGVDRQWDINIFNARSLGPAVLIGVGWRAYGEKVNAYTKAVYKKILSREYIHSVRDNYTKTMLNKMGFDNVINTSCATMWSFTPEFCKTIPTAKSDSVITTLTDYNKDPQSDKKMLDTLRENYRNVYLWVQGADDYEYAKNLTDIESLNIVDPSLAEYDKVLTENELDYVGTRLHGGIRALQKSKRALIVGIDNRAAEKKTDFNLPVIDRGDIDNLSDMINADFETKIKIPVENIEKFKNQFK